MKRILLYIFLALVALAAGIYLMYLFFTGLNNGVNPLLLLGSIALLGVGIFCLVRASKSDASVIKKGINTAPSNPDGLEKVLERNNAISKEWKNTNQLRTKLQTIQIASTPTPNE